MAIVLRESLHRTSVSAISISFNFYKYFGMYSHFQYEVMISKLLAMI
jgi:hypothetical protein